MACRRWIVYLIGSFLFMATSVRCASAQDLVDFFSQKKMDIQYMLQQIAALQVYIGYAEKGYQVAHDGLTAIGKFKKGEFDLHSVFIASLRHINPSVAGYSKVADILSCQLNIVHVFKHAVRTIQSSGHFTTGELAYINSVYSYLLTQSEHDLSELLDLLTSDTFGMKDNERIKRIDDLYADMKDKYVFTSSFTSQAVLLGAQRKNSTGDNDFLRKLY